MKNHCLPWILLVAVCLVPGCEKAASKDAKPALAEVTEEPAAAPAEQACDLAELKAQFGSSMADILDYYPRIQAIVSDGAIDCAGATDGFVDLEPIATEFVAKMQGYKEYAAKVESACKEEIKQISEGAAEQIGTRFSDLEQQFKALANRCQEHPGFQDAVTKGLRVMTKN